MVTKLKVIISISIAIVLTAAGAFLYKSASPPTLPKKIIAVSDVQRSKIIIIDAIKDQIIRSININKPANSIAFAQDKKLYAILQSDDFNPKSTLAIIDPYKIKVSYIDLKLPSCSEIKITKSKKALISFNYPSKAGFPLAFFDIKKRKTIKTIYIKESVYLSGNYKQEVYVSELHGQKDDLSCVYSINNKLSLVPLLKEFPEIPPLSLQRYKNYLVGINTGFDDQAAPSWLKKPDDYTNKLKIIDLKQKRISKAFNTSSKPFLAQRVNNKLFITHFSSYGKKVNKLSVFDLEKMKFIKIIPIDNPSDITLCNNKIYVISDEKNILVINPSTYKIVKIIKTKSLLNRLSSFDDID